VAFVQFTSSQDIIQVDHSQIEAIVACVLNAKHVRCDEVSVNFVSQEEITELHGEFFDDPTPTDCITFPIDDSDDEFYKVLGEIFVCPEVAKSYAADHDLDFTQELTLYVIHGLLHLLGYDDIDENDRVEMRKQEAMMLRLIEEKGLFIKELAPPALD